MSAATAAKRALKKSVREVCSRTPLARLLTWHGNRARPQVALTFDDGPDARYTPEVLDILARHGAVATFFLLGRNVESQAELVQHIAGAGHEIGIHGYDHTVRDLAGQTDQTRRLLDRLAIQTDLFRPPGGALLPSAQWWMARQRLRTVMWSYDLHDSMRHEGKASVRTPLAAIGPGDIVLMHDDNPVCTGELPELLAWLADRDLTPVTVSQLLA